MINDQISHLGYTLGFFPITVFRLRDFLDKLNPYAPENFRLQLVSFSTFDNISP